MKLMFRKSKENFYSEIKDFFFHEDRNMPIISIQYIFKVLLNSIHTSFYSSFMEYSQQTK